MNKEELKFNPLKPSLLILIIPGVYFFFSNPSNVYAVTHNLVAFIVLTPFGYIFLRYLQIAFLMLLGRPAVILTEENITITYTGDVIEWKDMIDVYLSSMGGGTRYTRSPKSYYIIIKVRDPQKYLMRIRNPFLRYLRRLKGKLTDSPFEIKLSYVRGDVDDNYQLVLKYYQNLRGF